MGRFFVKTFIDAGGTQCGVFDGDICTPDGRNVLVRSYSSQAAAANMAATLNATRATGIVELMALFPTSGAAPRTIGDTGGGSIVLTIGVPPDLTGGSLLYVAPPTRFAVVPDASSPSTPWALLDHGICTGDGKPFVVAQAVSRDQVDNLAFFYNLRRPDAGTELAALYPRAGASNITLGQSADGSATVTVGVF